MTLQVTALPTTPEAQAAEAMLAEAADAYLIGHSYRTFLFGASLVDTSEVDLEAAFIASLIHDIGLTDAFRGQKSFELVGADVAATFLESRGWELDRIHLVEAAIVRHTELEPIDSLECRIVQAGAALDVVGIPASALDSAAVKNIVASHPRDGFVDAMQSAFLAEVADQPEGAFAQLEAIAGLSNLVAQNPLDA